MILLQIFSGNSGGNHTVKHVLIEPQTTQFIRFQPIGYSSHKALRVEVYGKPEGKLSSRVVTKATLHYIVFCQGQQISPVNFGTCIFFSTLVKDLF